MLCCTALPTCESDAVSLVPSILVRRGSENLANRLPRPCISVRTPKPLLLHVLPLLSITITITTTSEGVELSSSPTCNRAPESGSG